MALEHCSGQRKLSFSKGFFQAETPLCSVSHHPMPGHTALRPDVTTSGSECMSNVGKPAGISLHLGLNLGELHFGSEQNEVKSEGVCDPLSYQSPEGSWFLEFRHVPSHNSQEIPPLPTQSSTPCISHGMHWQGSVWHDAPCTRAVPDVLRGSPFLWRCCCPVRGGRLS